MRTCQSCGLQNPDDRDFCECGEYLRWEPTGYVQAITPEMAAQAAAEAAAPADPPPADAPAAAAAPPQPEAPPEPAAPAAPTPPKVSEAAPVEVPADNGHENGHGSGLTNEEPPAAPPAPPAAKTAVHAAVPVPPPQPQAFEDPDMARITLRLPDRDTDTDAELETAVEPGQRDRILAMVRNQSGIVDNYVLRIEGLPDDWWSIYPDTVYLVPFGTGGTYEQEVEIHLHPPRSPEAEAKLWDLQVVAHSKAHNVTAASAPLGLEILPYTETSTKVSPQRAKGRRKAHFDVGVENKANAPVLVALEGEDPDDELAFGFDRPPQQIPPGQTVTTEMQVRPPKQIWIGRPQEKRFSVNTITGDAAEERLAAEPTAAEELKGRPDVRKGKRSWFRGRGTNDIPGVYGPRVYKPQVYKPGMNIGPSGISFRKPQLQGPQLQGPQLGNVNVDANKLQGSLPGRKSAPAAPSQPLLPSQAVFRQKAWLPWWLIPVGIALAAIAVVLYLLLPKNVAVPDLVGQKSTFDAEKKLTDAGLKLAPNTKDKVDTKAPPGSIVGQTPAAGKKAKKDSEVTVLVAVGDGKISVPKVTGLALSDAEAALRGKKLSLGQSSPQPPDPNGKIASQIPAENEIVKEGTPVDVFFEDPNGKGKGKDVKAGGAGGAGGGAGGGGGGGGGGAKDILIPAISGATLEDYAKKLADEGLVPETERQFNEAKLGTPFATEPPGGTKAAAGDKVKVLVSAGFPQLAYDNEKNVLLVNGANGKPLDPIAKGTLREKDPTWQPDGSHVAYTGNGRVFLKDMTKPDSTALPLTAAGDEYSDLAWAPTADVNLIAMAKHTSDTDADLCLGEVTGKGMTVRCLTEPKFTIGRNIHWSPDGKQIIAVGSTKLNTFGMIRWRSKKPFSTDPKDWGKGRFVTDTSKSGEGAYDAAWSPDGKRLAVVSNQGGGPFRLFLAKKDDFLLASAKETGVRACKVAWRSDGKQLVVVQADEFCQEENGELKRLPVNNPDQQQQVGVNGDNPVFQPLTLGP